ncbi:hypothetical protein M1394_00790 [Candidatus Marsarchaeota archaeon]|nr:hypothetical protein [Candidatus Marsarchaeota archaeon]
MDLLSKTVIVAAVIIVIMIAFYYGVVGLHLGKKAVTSQEAAQIVLTDLKNSNQNAVINITNVSPSVYSGSWHIIASVVYNATSPCPSYSVYSFDYPQYGLVNRTENSYTYACQIYGYGGSGPYEIESYPAAITFSYISNTTGVMRYIHKYGFSNVRVRATYQNRTMLSGRNFSNVWVVVYSSNATQTSLYDILSQQNGSVEAVYNFTT